MGGLQEGRETDEEDHPSRDSKKAYLLIRWRSARKEGVSESLRRFDGFGRGGRGWGWEKEKAQDKNKLEMTRQDETRRD
jgi:hypothetical protein